MPSPRRWSSGASRRRRLLPTSRRTPTRAGLKQIAYEKWVSLFNLETEAYAEYRRLDYPVLTPGPEAVTATIPTRLPYPDIENSLNAGNLATAEAAQGNTDITGKVWWDKP